MKVQSVWRGMTVSMLLVGAGVGPGTMRAEVPVPAAAVVGQPGGGQPQVKDDLFAGTEKFAKNASDVTEVNLDPSMLGAVGGSKGNGANVARRLDFIVVHSYEYDQPGMYKMEDIEEYRAKLAGAGGGCFIHDRSKQESSDICQRTGSDPETHELAIVTAEPKELTFVHLKGRMSLAELSMQGKMASSGGMMGLLIMGGGMGGGPVILNDVVPTNFSFKVQGPSTLFSPQQQQELDDLRKRLHDPNRPMSDQQRKQDEERLRVLEKQAKLTQAP